MSPAVRNIKVSFISARTRVSGLQFRCFRIVMCGDPWPTMRRAFKVILVYRYSISLAIFYVITPSRPSESRFAALSTNPIRDFFRGKGGPVRPHNPRLSRDLQMHNACGTEREKERKGERSSRQNERARKRRSRRRREQREERARACGRKRGDMQAKVIRSSL